MTRYWGRGGGTQDSFSFLRSKIGLHNCLKHLESFCSTWLLEVNLKKTKIMIFSEMW